MKELLEKRDKAAKAYRDLIKEMQDADRAPQADDRAKIDAMIEEIEGLDAQLREVHAAQADKVREMDEALKNLRVGGFDTPKGKESRGDEERADFLEFLRNGEIKAERRTAMSDTDGGTGGYVVPEKFHDELKEYEADMCPIYDLATKTYMEGGDKVFPVVTAFGATSLVARGSAKTAVVPTITQSTLTGYQFIWAYDVPEALLRKSAYNIEKKFPKWWAKSHASCMEDYYAEGTGSSEPTGLASGATAGTDSAANSAIAANDVITWYYDLDPAYRKRASWIFADSSIALIRKITNTVSTSGALNYVWIPGLAGSPDTLMGKPIYASDGFSDLTAGDPCGVFGDISEFQIVEFGKPSLIRDPYTLAKYGQVSFIGYRLIDCCLPVAEAVITCAIAE